MRSVSLVVKIVRKDNWPIVNSLEMEEFTGSIKRLQLPAKDIAAHILALMTQNVKVTILVQARERISDKNLSCHRIESI